MVKLFKLVFVFVYDVRTMGSHSKLEFFFTKSTAAVFKIEQAFRAKELVRKLLKLLFL